MTGENTSTELSSSPAPESSPSESKQKWSGFKYEMVTGLSDRIISRYLRSQRKNLRRFFATYGLWDLLERMEQIKRSRQGMLAKNQMFQKVMNEYATRLASPTESTPVEVQRGMVLPSNGAAQHDEPNSPLVGVPRADGDGAGTRDGVRPMEPKVYESYGGVVIDE